MLVVVAEAEELGAAAAVVAAEAAIPTATNRLAVDGNSPAPGPGSCGPTRQFVAVPTPVNIQVSRFLFLLSRLRLAFIKLFNDYNLFNKRFPYKLVKFSRQIYKLY